jgi:hypothetical protein
MIITYEQYHNLIQHIDWDSIKTYTLTRPTPVEIFEEYYKVQVHGEPREPSVTLIFPSEDHESFFRLKYGECMNTNPLMDSVNHIKTVLEEMNAILYGNKSR